MQSDERLNQLETIVARLSRRQVKRVVSIVPSIPVTLYGETPDANGVLARFMFPGSGVLKRVCIFFTSMNKPTLARIDIERADSLEQHSFNVPKRGLVQDISYEVAALDRMSLISETYPVWAAFLWQPAMKDGDIRNYLIDELEAANAADKER